MIEITALASSSKGNCYRITDGHTPLLLECGINYRDIQKGFDFRMSEVAGCLISHEHGDHCKSIKDVLKAGIDVYTSHGTAEALGIEHHRIKRVRAKEQFQLGTWTILPFDVQHDVSEPLGFLLANLAGDKLIFATDTYYIKYKFQGITHIMVEANYSMDKLNENILNGRTPAVMKKRLLRSHFSLENVKEFLMANDLSKVQEIWLLHLSDSNSDEAMFKREIMELTGKMVIIPQG
ncbi:MBL fold metallo-hydrolase [Schinkia azotoformans]|uniref:MBL fold metallo-hydrolase n=1 Tax=Schinkia azotoformans TaxID=1454 RepID=UPI002DBE8ED6|nr:MBL fold metallo-hydrolase [Schinkia azotoformans]MEC1714718.1 MBL fold metallo-hydrolase [Schinkia azotoformans]MEC1757526.1 MBL fold metallo-hydrolase [Schinkia azotoformans]